MTKAGLKHFDEFADTVTKEFNLNSNDLIIDIGSNVGILLNSFKKRKLRVLGIDPAKNICQIANKNKIKTLNSFSTKAYAIKFKKFLEKLR